MDTEAGIPMGVSSTAVAAAMDDAAEPSRGWPPIKAVLVTSPTYHGSCSNISAIAQVRSAAAQAHVVRAA